MLTVVQTGTKIFKRDTKGKVREWQYLIGRNQDVWGWATVAGLADGKKVTSDWTIVEAKNVGKANEVSPEGQAYAEAVAEGNKKLARGYFLQLDDVDTFDKFKPMLAHDYNDYPIDWSKDVVYDQPKLDGIRCIARADGLWTRTGKPITSVPHIVEALEFFFDGNPDAVYDGELYNHELRDDFNTITSAVRKQTPTVNELADAKRLIQFHFYDLIEDPDDLFEQRAQSLLGDFDLWWSMERDDMSVLQLVETTKVTSQEQLDARNGKHIEDGYEGQMVRINAPYQNKRTKFLLKRKDFITEEFKVKDILEGNGNWRGCVKHLLLEDHDGREFKSGIRGSKEKLRKMWDDGRVPDWATIRYFMRTPDGVPRFPIAVDWGIGERDD